MSDDNADRDRRLYKIPGSDVLRNKLGITDAAVLHRAERLLVQRRTRVQHEAKAPATIKQQRIGSG